MYHEWKGQTNMAMIKINPDVDENQTFEARPAGIYPLLLTNELKVEKAKTSENNIIKFEWKFNDEKGGVVFDTLTLTSKAEFRIKQCAMACGVPMTADGDIDLDDFVGASCNAQVGTRLLPAQVDPTSGQTLNEARMVNNIKKYLIEE